LKLHKIKPKTLLKAQKTNKKKEKRFLRKNKIKLSYLFYRLLFLKN